MQMIFRPLLPVLPNSSSALTMPLEGVSLTDTDSLYSFCPFVGIALCSSGWPPTRESPCLHFQSAGLLSMNPLHLDLPSLLNYFSISSWIISPAMFSSSPISKKNHAAPNLQLLQSSIFAILSFLSHTVVSPLKVIAEFFFILQCVSSNLKYMLNSGSIHICWFIASYWPYFPLVYVLGKFWVDIRQEAGLGVCLLCVSHHHICAVPRAARRGRQIPWSWSYPQMWATYHSLIYQ